MVESESNLDEVVAAYQQEERKLSFLDELRQVVQVAGGKGKSAAQATARSNLRQAGVALHNYSQEYLPAGPANAQDVQGQAQQIQADIGRLEQSKSEAGRAEGGAAADFGKPPVQEPEESSRRPPIPTATSKNYQISAVRASPVTGSPPRASQAGRRTARKVKGSRADGANVQPTVRGPAIAFGRAGSSVAAG